MQFLFFIYIWFNITIMPFRPEIEFVPHDKLHFQRPDIWAKKEYNNFISRCNRVDVEYSQSVAFTDTVDIVQFAPKMIGDNKANTGAAYLLPISSVVPFGVNATDIGLVAVPSMLVLNQTTGASTRVVSVTDDDNIVIEDDIFTAMPQTVVLYPYISTGVPSFSVDYEVGNVLFCKSASTEIVALTSLDIIDSGKTYYVNIEIRNYVSGVLNVYLGTTLIGSVDTNGSHEFYGVSNGNVLSLISFDDADFIGCVKFESVEVYEVQTEYSVGFFTPGEPLIYSFAPTFNIHKGIAYVLFDINYGIISSECKCIYIFIGDVCLAEMLQTDDGLFIDECWRKDEGITIVEGLMVFNAVENGASTDYVCDYTCEYECNTEYEIIIQVEGFQEGEISVNVNGEPVGVISADGEFSFEFTSTVDCETVGGVELVATGEPITTATINSISLRKVANFNNVLGFSERLLICEEGECEVLIDYRNNVDAYAMVYEPIPEHRNRIRICGEVSAGTMVQNDFIVFKSSPGFLSTIYANLDYNETIYTEWAAPYLTDALQVAFAHNDVLIDDEPYVMKEWAQVTTDENTYLQRFIAVVAKKNQTKTYTYSS